MKFVLLATLCMCLIVSIDQTFAFSMTKSSFEKLVQDRCFSSSKETGLELELGQKETVGLTIENLISLLERIEQFYPTWKPETIIKALLQRFHMDGLKYNGRYNIQSNTEFQHSLLTNVILSKEKTPTQVATFLEDQLSDDEKCNLFFTMSHSINETALENEQTINTYMSSNFHKAKAPAVPSRHLGDEVPITVKPTPKAEQSKYLDDDDDLKKKRATRSEHTYITETRLTKTPRENGVASFLSAKTNPIAVNRLLLGLYVGLANPNSIKISEVLEKMEKSEHENYEDKEMDPLLAVTLSDLYGMDTGEGMTNENNKEIFGADGEWNSTVCHTKFRLTTKGYWGTLAEFRGGLDGYNIGRLAGSLKNRFRNVPASQILRLYYSKYGLEGSTGVCQRKYHTVSLKDDLTEEALSYLITWNFIVYNNQFSQEEIEGYIASIKKQFFDTLEKAAIQNEEEIKFCSDLTSPCENNANVFFLLDEKQRCRDKSDCQQAKLVNTITKRLEMDQSRGSLSVFYNLKPLDVNGESILKPLYTVDYNSTSSECASCKAKNSEVYSREQITDRVELLEQINNYLESLNQPNQTTVPANLFFWFDYGTVKPIPDDKVQKVKYENIQRKLIYIRRDVSFYGITTNDSNIKDIVQDSSKLLTIDSSIENKLNQVAESICKVPSIFQYKECDKRASNNFVHQSYITSGYKQYWAMYPNYFLKSFDIQMKFTSENLIQVCFDRIPFPEQNSKNCKKATKIEDGVTFRVANPCKDLTFAKCPGFYFTISVDKSLSSICDGPQCKNINQVKWNFTHTGISCNHSTVLSISVVSLVLSFIISLVMRALY